MAAAGIVLLGWVAIFLVVLFFSGFQVFQNYVSNAYFWLLSGMIFALPMPRIVCLLHAGRGRRRDLMMPLEPICSKTLSPPEVADAAMLDGARFQLTGDNRGVNTSISCGDGSGRLELPP